MLFHATWNLIALTAMLLSLQFVSKEINVIERDDVKISYQQVPVLDSKVITVTSETNKVIGKNTTIKTLLDFTLIDSDLKEKYSSIVPMARYNFTIEFKDGKTNFEEVLKILQEEKMVIRN